MGKMRQREILESVRATPRRSQSGQSIGSAGARVVTPEDVPTGIARAARSGRGEKAAAKIQRERDEQRRSGK